MSNSRIDFFQNEQITAINSTVYKTIAQIGVLIVEPYQKEIVKLGNIEIYLIDDLIDKAQPTIALEHEYNIVESTGET